METASLNGVLSVAALIELLSDPNEDVRVFAAARLVSLGTQAQPAVASLIALLGSESPIDRRMAAWALGAVGPEASEAIPSLLGAQEDGDAIVRKFVSEAIHKIDLPIARQNAA